MKRIIISTLLLFFVLLSTSTYCQLQNEITSKTYIVTKQNGTKFIGEIISKDSREILMDTDDLGKIYIPMHVVSEIREILPENKNNIVSDEIFATRYFISTNGLPIKKGENYIQWNLFGPDFQFGIADNFGVGVMTSWAAIPIIATMKYSMQLNETTNLGLGALIGTGSWALPNYGLMLPFLAITKGNRRNNINFSAGYGLIFYEETNEYLNNSGEIEWNTITTSEGRFLFSIAGMAKLNEKFSLVFDTFISPLGPEKEYNRVEYHEQQDPITGEYSYYHFQTKEKERSPGLALILPGIRWQIDANKAFQFGFTGFYFDGEFVQFPIPMVQWYRRL